VQSQSSISIGNSAIPVYPPLNQPNIAVSSFQAVEHTPSPPIDSSEERNGRKLASNHGNGDSHGRFLDIDKKLCKMGIGWNVSTYIYLAV